MNESGSYRPEETYGALGPELRRLEAQVELSWEPERRLLESIGVRDGQDILEAGCGPGHFTARLLSWLPRSRVTALDVRADLLEHLPAVVAGARAGDRLRVVCGSVYDSGLAAASHDVIIARYLFQHLTDPAAAVAALGRLLRPGGLLAVIDMDAGLWGVAQPCVPALEEVYRKAEGLQTGRGGDRCIGRRLWRLLSRAGFEQCRLEAFVYHSDELGLDRFDAQMDTARLGPALAADLITPREFLQAEIAYRQFRGAADAFVLMLGLAAHGRKPARS